MESDKPYVLLYLHKKGALRYRSFHLQENKTSDTSNAITV
jgi:hypothetical protein